MDYRVRQGFVLHRPDRPPVTGGAIVSLTAAEFERYAHQLEPLGEEPSPVPDPFFDPEDEPEAEPETEQAAPKRTRRKKDDDD